MERPLRTPPQATRITDHEPRHTMPVQYPHGRDHRQRHSRPLLPPRMVLLQVLRLGRRHQPRTPIRYRQENRRKNEGKSGEKYIDHKGLSMRVNVSHISYSGARTRGKIRGKVEGGSMRINGARNTDHGPRC